MASRRMSDAPCVRRRRPIARRIARLASPQLSKVAKKSELTGATRFRAGVRSGDIATTDATRSTITPLSDARARLRGCKNWLFAELR